MPSKPLNSQPETLGEIFADEPTPRDALVKDLQESLADIRDARREERFVFIVICVLLLDVVFFTVMPSFGGPLALLILELLVLIPLAKRMGMEEIAKMLDRVVNRIIPGNNSSD